MQLLEFSRNIVVVQFLQNSLSSQDRRPQVPPPLVVQTFNHKQSIQKKSPLLSTVWVVITVPSYTEFSRKHCVGKGR